MSSPSTSSHEPSPAPLRVKKTSKEKSKNKSKKASTVVVTELGKNEGENPNWAFQPPPGSVLADHEVDSGEFDWNAVKDDEDVELWLLRVPEDIKPKYLERMKIDPPSSPRTARIGTLNRKQTTYDVWNIGDGDGAPIGGEEIKGLSCLLPRSSKHGKLFRAPKPITRHIVVSAPPVVAANPLPETGCSFTGPYQNPPRFCYPKEVLKHKFLPYGAQTSVNDVAEVIEVDVEMADEAEVEAMTEIEPSVKQVKEKKSKKRKVDGDSPKRSKKVKTQDI